MTAEVLVIPDGAAEDPLAGPTSLERASTPALDALCAEGAVEPAVPTPAGLPPGSETGIPTLLGAPPEVPLSRGVLEAAAAGIELAPGLRAWRCDLYRAGVRYRPGSPGRLAGALAASAPGAEVHHLRGHRFLLVAPRRPQPRLVGIDVHVWGGGAIPGRGLDRETTIVCGPGAAAGIGRLMGAHVVVPPGATGGPDTDLAAKRAAALAELGKGSDPQPKLGKGSDPEPNGLLVVHIGAPDEAAHERDADAKVAALEAIDREIVGPLGDAALAVGGRITVCPDHGTDPASGRHLRGAVPRVTAGEGIVPSGPDRLAERLLGTVREVAAL